MGSRASAGFVRPCLRPRNGTRDFRSRNTRLGAEQDKRLLELRAMYGIHQVADETVPAAIIPETPPSDDLVSWGVNLDFDLLVRECDM